MLRWPPQEQFRLPPPEADIDAALTAHAFFERVSLAHRPLWHGRATDALDAIEAQALRISQTLDLGLDALSLASIYFLAAIGLAITFGVMRVINMAHGEFIMMGAYTGFVVQQIIPNYTVSILVALPLAFAVTFAAGVAMERLVIRHGSTTAPLRRCLQPSAFPSPSSNWPRISSARRRAR